MVSAEYGRRLLLFLLNLQKKLYRELRYKSIICISLFAAKQIHHPLAERFLGRGQIQHFFLLNLL